MRKPVCTLLAELGRSLSRMQKLRLAADYLTEPVPAESAKWAVGEANTFVAGCLGLTNSRATHPASGPKPPADGPIHARGVDRSPHP